MFLVSRLATKLRLTLIRTTYVFEEIFASFSIPAVSLHVLPKAVEFLSGKDHANEEENTDHNSLMDFWQLQTEEDVEE